MRRLLVAAAAIVVASPLLTACAGGRFEVSAIFDDVGDLQSRGSVQVADVRVGTIKSIRLTSDYRARVTMSIDKGVRVPRQSAAVLRTTSLLGEKFVELRPLGDPGRGPYLDDGDVVRRTQEAPEVEFVAEQAIGVLGSVVAADVAVLVEAGALAFGGRGPELQRLVADLATLSRGLADKTEEITRIIDGLDRATEALAGGAGEIGDLLANLAQTTQVLADNRHRAVSALAQLTRLAAVENDLLDRYRGDIDRQIKQVDAILQVAVTQTGEAANLIDWLDRFAIAIPKVIPGEFTQVFMWAYPAEQDPRVGRP